jgi:chemotaxis protein histidine kinase CheA
MILWRHSVLCHHMPVRVAAVTDRFADRLAKVRARFMSSVEGKIRDTYVMFPKLLGGTAAVDTLAEIYRRIHGICGVAETVGFIQTGRTARQLDSILVVAHQARRGLTADEMPLAQKALHALRDAMRLELQSAFVGLR